jgi:plasmid stabilization system protein ParE
MRIVWTRPACSDLEGIRDYIARDSEYYAACYVEKILAAVRQLEKSPELGEVLLHVQSGPIRQLLFQNHSILYQVRSEHLAVLAVVHAGRDLTSLEPKPWDLS